MSVADPALRKIDLAEGASNTSWNYDEAFSRNIGLVTLEEQRRLRQSQVAIAGMGGVGGVHLITLARLGIGGFRIADPDRFELVNMNRQYGARLDTLGQPKADVMAQEVRRINAEAKVQLWNEPLDRTNIDAFLDGANLVIDGLDFFAIGARRLLFERARQKGLWVLTSGPYAFGATLLCFSPTGQSFDDYFDIREGMSEAEQVIAFAVGSSPRPIHLAYLDLKKFVSTGEKRAASAGLACQLCSGIIGAEAIKILLNRGKVRPAPCYLQFDAYRQKLVKGRLLWGNRNPLQKLKRNWLTRQMALPKGR